MRRRLGPWCAAAIGWMAAGCAADKAERPGASAPASGAATASRPAESADPEAAARELYAFVRAKYDRDGDGVVTRAEYGADADAFARLDRDADGRVALGDFLRPAPPPPELGLPYLFVRAFGPPNADLAGADDAAAVLRELDADADGRASAPEIAKRAGPEGAAYLLGHLDRDRDGGLDPAELAAFVRERDRDGDGRIARRERERPGREPRVGAFPPAERAPAPPFRLATVEGDRAVALADLRGKPTLLIFGSFT